MPNIKCVIISVYKTEFDRDTANKAKATANHEIYNLEQLGKMVDQLIESKDLLGINIFLGYSNKATGAKFSDFRVAYAYLEAN